MKIPFSKMHGAANDFIVVDDRDCRFPIDDAGWIRHVCSRRTGVGCDGILLIQPSEATDFRMRFINPDGNEVEMCGNGARCIARRAHDLGMVPDRLDIETVAGIVHAEIRGDSVCIHLTKPRDMQLDLDAGLEWLLDFVNTGVPHAVAWVDEVSDIDLAMHGRIIREHDLFAPKGTNANFAKVEADGSLTVRTYERGVEAETLACGTGAAAVAVIAAQRGIVKLPVAVHCTGGFDLVIDAAPGGITLLGGAEYVFDGVIDYGNRV